MLISEKLICDVCKKNEALGVASSPFGPVSSAYCRECLEKPAEPEWIFQYLYEDVSENGEGIEMGNYHTFKNDHYISWDEYKQLRSSEPKVESP